MERNDSWPAVSQICSLRNESSTLMQQEPKSTPTVTLCSVSNLSFVKRVSIHDFPTPKESLMLCGQGLISVNEEYEWGVSDFRIHVLSDYDWLLHQRGFFPRTPRPLCLWYMGHNGVELINQSQDEKTESDKNYSSISITVDKTWMEGQLKEMKKERFYLPVSPNMMTLRSFFAASCLSATSGRRSTRRSSISCKLL